MTKRYSLSFFISLVLWWVTPVFTYAYEHIDLFSSDIAVKDDGTFLVTETLVYDFEQNERHGIFRTIPLQHAQEASVWYKDRYIDVSLVEVERNGETEPYDVILDSDTFEVKIGDVGKTHSGIQTYRISYEVTGALLYYDNATSELFWNATGHEWPVPIMRAEITVSDVDGIFIPERACYQGYVGETTSCSIAPTSSAVTFIATNLGPGAGLTVAQALDLPPASEVVIEKVRTHYVFMTLVFVMMLAFVSAVYRYKTKHKPDTTQVTEFEPFPGVLPMFTGVLVDGRLDARDITAGLLYLAQQGFIQIKKIDKKVLYFFEVDDYEVTLMRSKSDLPSFFHEELLDLLFFADDIGSKVMLSDLKDDTSKQRANARRMIKLNEAVAADVIERGFYETLTNTTNIIVGSVALYLFLQFVGLPGVIFLAAMMGVTMSMGASITLFVLMLLPIIFVISIYRRRTKLGYEALHHIKGFREFLSVTDKERFAFHNAPSKSPETFLEYLPYAVALGVEKEWATVFADVTIPNPDWYKDGSSGTFTVTAISNDLGAFSNALSGATSGPGTASSSSGSSGGGFSGGGSGGGGGGSW